MVTVSDLRACGWPVTDGFLDGLSDYERDFVRLEFTGRRTLDYYRQRVRYLSFDGMDRVLDAGCGMGQWSVALSECNGAVVGVDLMPGRLDVARRLAESMRRTNITFQEGTLEKLPFPSASFDGIFCYGVFMFTHMPITLGQFARLLKPGGKLYLNANSYGWYVHLLRDVPWNRRPAMRMIWNTLRGREQSIVVGERWLRKRLTEHGFDVVMLDVEGDASFEAQPATPKPERGYQSRYWGLRAILEATAIRRQ